MDKDKAIALLEAIKEKVIGLREHEDEFNALINEAAELELSDVCYIDNTDPIGQVITDSATISNLDDAIVDIRNYEPVEEDDEEETDEDDEDEDAIEAV